MGWGSWFGGGSRSDGASDKAQYKFSREDNDTTWKQESLSRTKESGGQHEHTWSETKADGSHKEGWHGDKFEKPKK